MTDRRGPNKDLGHLVETYGLTLGRVAAMVQAVAAESGQVVGTNASGVRYWITRGGPRADTAPYLCEAMSRLTGRPLSPEDVGLDPQGGDAVAELSTAAGDVVGAVTILGRTDMEPTRRSVLATAAFSVATLALTAQQAQAAAARRPVKASGQRIGAADVAAMVDMAKAYTQLDERYGGRHGRAALAAYVCTDVATILRGTFATPELRQQAFSTAAYLTHLCGWKAYDVGEQGLAQAWYLQALDLAREGGVLGQDAFVLRTMTHQALKLRHPEHCVQLADAALQRVQGKVAPAVESMFTVTRAEAFAAAGRGRPAMAEVERAQQLLAADPDGEVPFWATAWGGIGANVASRAAKTYEKLRRWDLAQRNFTASADGRPPEQYARIHGLELAWAGDALLQQGALEESCHVWNRALDVLGGVGSVRTTKAMKNIARDLSPYRKRGATSAAATFEKATTLLRA